MTTTDDQGREVARGAAKEATRENTQKVRESHTLKDEQVKDQQVKDEYIGVRYEDAINYYWDSSKSNKRWYKITRSLTVILGALVTLSASLSSSSMLADNQVMKAVFDLGTPVLAATLAIIGGFSHSFQWGSTWQNMVLTAQ